LTYGPPWLPLALLVISAGIALSPARNRVSRRALALGLWWGAMPVVVLWLLAYTVPAAHALFDPRYVVFTLPGTALALGSCARVGPALPTSAGRWRYLTLGALLPLIALALSTGRQQAELRDASTGHVEDMNGVVRALEGRVQPGDAVLYVPGYLSIFGDYFEKTFRPLDDAARDPHPPAPSAITTPDLPGGEIAAALTGHDRVWVVASVADLKASAATDEEKLRLLREDFHPLSHQVVPFFNVWLFERR
jgi:mannosyltransferase